MPFSRAVSARYSARVLSTIAAATLAAGCAVGPDFQRPAPPAADAYTPDPLPAQTVSSDTPAGAAQQFAAGQDIPGEWWALFHSPALDALIQQAIKTNPSLDAAKAALRQARENASAAEGALFPTVSGSVSATREKVSSAEFGLPGGSVSPFSVGTASLNVSYALDVFGGTRRAIESADAQAEYERFQLEAAYLSLTSNVVTAAVSEASFRAQIDAAREIIDVESHQADVLQQQFDLGGVAGAAVLAQKAALAQARAALPPLENQLAQAHNRLAVLAGKLPSEGNSAPFDLAGLELPRELPISLPSKLVDQRPDVRASEATLHQASAEIGVATAAMLPQISLTGSYGSAASPVSNLLGAGTGVWSIGGNLAQTIFDGGALLHKRRAAVAAYDEAAATYRGTVLSAFQDVANALRALQSDADAVNANLAAERAAAASLDVSRAQFQLGGINYVALLTAEQAYQQTRISLVQAQAARYSDTAALFQALGGGWWNRGGNDIAADDSGAKTVTE